MNLKRILREYSPVVGERHDLHIRTYYNIIKNRKHKNNFFLYGMCSALNAIRFSSKDDLIGLLKLRL